MVRESAKKKLEADIPQDLHDQFKQWISDHKNGSMRQCIQAMVELWLSLPEELQALTLICPRDSASFNEAVRCTVEILRSRQNINYTIAASPKPQYAVASDNDTSPAPKKATGTRKKKKRRANR